MKTTKKAWVGMTLMLAMLVTACGSNSGNDGQTSGESAEGNEEAVALTMAFLNFGVMDDEQLVEDEINKIALEKINATVDFMPIDIAAWQQQTNLLLAGNEKLDLIMTSSFFNYASQVAKGQLVPLDELLEQYGPDIKNTMDPAIYNGTKVNGQIYGVPSIRDVGADYGMVMRKDLVDKHGIDLSAVKSWADLGDKVFKVIKENEPGVIPLVQSSQTGTVAYQMFTPHIDPLSDRYGVIAIDDQEMKVQNLYEMPVYRDTLKLVREWYEAGYIMQDAATTQESGQSLVKAGKALGYFNNMKPEYEKQETKSTGHEMVGVRLSDVVIQSNGANAFMMSIARNSEEPERAMQFLNLLYTDANIMNLLANGIEGKHYVKNEDGSIRMPDGVTESKYLFNQWEIGNNFLTSVWEGTSLDIWEKTKAFNASAKVSPALGFTFDQSPVKTEVAAVTNVENKYRIGLESGTLDPAQLDQFIAELKSAGIDNIIAEKQKQLDAWAAANGK